MEAQALNRFVGTSPRKMMIVIDLIRGRGVEEALSILHFSPKHAAKDAEKVLRSAISNLQSKDQAGRVDTATMYVKEVFVNGGPMAKRISPAPMGRAFRIRKRSHHLTIVVATREAKVKAAARTAAPKAAATDEASPKAAKKATKAPKKATTTETKES
jgi:large subunit ribosomal protein L22